MKNLLSLVLAVSIGLPQLLDAQEPSTMTLQDAINYAFDHTTAVKSAQLNIADADQQIIERRATGIPQLSAGANYQYFIDIPTQILPDFLSPTVYGVLFQENLLEEKPIDTGGGIPAQFGTKNNLTASIDLNAMIVDGSYFIGLQAARLYRQYVQQELISTRRSVQNQVVNAYLPTLIIDISLETLEKNMTSLNAMLLETRELYKEGFIEQLDVDRLELSLANLEAEKQNLLRNREIAMNVLKFTIGYPLEAELDLTDDLEALLEEVDDQVLTADINYSSRPEYGVAQMGAQLNELNIKLNKTTYYPSLYGFGSHQQSLLANKLSDGEWFPTTVVGLQLNVPIFDGLNKKAKVQRAKLGLELAKIQINQLEQSIDLEVQNARTAYLSANETLASRQKNLDLAQKIYNTTQIKYREGIGSSLEVTLAEQELYQSQQNYHQALYDLLVAKTKLDQALGI